MTFNFQTYSKMTFLISERNSIFRHHQPLPESKADFKSEYTGDINGKAIFSGEINLKKISPSNLESLLKAKEWWNWKYQIQSTVSGTDVDGNEDEDNVNLLVNLVQLAIIGQLSDHAKVLIELAYAENKFQEILTEPVEIINDCKELSLYETSEWIIGANAVHVAARFDPKTLSFILGIESKLKDVKTLITSYTPLHVSAGVHDAKSTKVCVFFISSPKSSKVFFF